MVLKQNLQSHPPGLACVLTRNLEGLSVKQTAAIFLMYLETSQTYLVWAGTP